MFCMNCGQQLPDGAKFCMRCGTPQGAVSPTNSVNAVSVSPINSQTANAAKPSLVPAMCPNCSAHLKVDTSYKIARCGSCGTEILVQDAVNKLSISGTVNLVHSGSIAHSGTVTYKKDYTNEPNLYISYASTDPSLGITIKISKLNITSILNSGMTQSYKIASGQYLLKIKFGTLMRVNVNAERIIVIRSDGLPTRVDIGWQGGIFDKYYINVTA